MFLNRSGVCPNSHASLPSPSFCLFSSQEKIEDEARNERRRKLAGSFLLSLHISFSLLSLSAERGLQSLSAFLLSKSELGRATYVELSQGAIVPPPTITDAITLLSLLLLPQPQSGRCIALAAADASTRAESVSAVGSLDSKDDYDDEKKRGKGKKRRTRRGRLRDNALGRMGSMHGWERTFIRLP